MSSDLGTAWSSSRPGWGYRTIRERITAERLGSYLMVTEHDLERAFHLYEWNINASAGILATSAMVKVIVRNALDEKLHAWARRRDPVASWFDIAPMDAKGYQDIAKARARATNDRRQVEIHGKVIAELTLGFWRYLVAPRYHTSLWIPSLHKAFPDGAQDLRQRRDDVERRLRDLLFVRNRVAHHEPIYRRHLGVDLARMIELVGWISADAAAWVAAKSPLGGVVGERPETGS